jgi:hypothetical protein
MSSLITPADPVPAYRTVGEDVTLPHREQVIPLDDVGLPIHGGN